MTIEQKTGTTDPAYDLVSVLYHALQGAETYDRYIADANERGDDQLAQFFGHDQQSNSSVAARAKELLSLRLTA